MKSLTTIAEELGFTQTAYLPVDQIQFVPEYRQYCEENTCGKYHIVPMCPPTCGTFEELQAKVLTYTTAFVMKTVWVVNDFQDNTEFNEIKLQHNMITKELVQEANQQGLTGLTITAGPTADTSCMSAYCIEVYELTKSCGMRYYEGNDKIAIYSMFLYNE